VPAFATVLAKGMELTGVLLLLPLEGTTLFQLAKVTALVCSTPSQMKANCRHLQMWLQLQLWTSVAATLQRRRLRLKPFQLLQLQLLLLSDAATDTRCHGEDHRNCERTNVVITSMPNMATVFP